MRKQILTALGVAAVAGGFGLADARGASHSDAPLIKQDPQANLTDVYAFVGTRYDQPEQEVLNVVVHVRPLSEPGDGVIFERFADDARYSIHITDPATGETALRYDFRFSDVNPMTPPGLKNPDTLLSYGLGTAVGALESVDDETRNYTQTYTVKRTDQAATTGPFITPPPNVGARTTPAYNDPVTGLAVSGAATFDELDVYTREAIADLPSGEAVFAGPREDGFYLDIAGVSDLLDPRILGPDGLGQTGNGVDLFKGYNVLAFAVQIPVAMLESVPGAPTVGVYASVSRSRLTLRKAKGEPLNIGPMIQINRMGNPLFNEALVALADKDRYNRSAPTDDAQFATYAENPELAKLINLVVFGGDEVIAETGRSDLAGIFIPDVIRVDLSTGPVTLAGEPGFDRLSVFGGDLSANGTPSGWPNGRRFGDDVVDITLTALAGGAVPVLGDNVNSNDQVFHRVFPYSATPHAGTNNSKDPLVSP